MGKIYKFLIFLIILAGIGLVAYAYLGPRFGVDFDATQSEIRQPVTLNAK